MDRLQYKLGIFEALSACLPTNKSILTDDEDNRVVIPLVKRWNHYNPPSFNPCHGFYPGYSRIKGLTCIVIIDVLMTFQDLTSADLKTTRAIPKHVVKNAMVLFILVTNKRKYFLQ
ncbi:hypothetical protein TNCV_395051 [Trichonephila clavipes]|nr:hypothetical protein TNCV_395051 [Trichonephila clavipes]